MEQTDSIVEIDFSTTFGSEGITAVETFAYYFTRHLPLTSFIFSYRQVTKKFSNMQEKSSLLRCKRLPLGNTFQRSLDEDYQSTKVITQRLTLVWRRSSQMPLLGTMPYFYIPLGIGCY